MPPIATLLWLVLSGPNSPVVDAISMRGTVWIRAGDRAVGAGWVVDTNRCLAVTARHVVADRETVEVFFLDDRDGRPITDRAHYLSNRADLLKRGRLVTGRLVAKDDRADLAILRLDSLPANVPALKLSGRPPRPGQSCSSIGHRHDAELLWGRTSGVVRQVGRLSDGYFWSGSRLGAGASAILFQSPIESGESGAALLDVRGEVIGVVSAVSNRTPGLAIAIAIPAVRKLLAEVNREQRVETVISGVERRPDIAALLHGSVWVRPRATDGRAAGVLIDRERRLLLTTAAAVAGDQVVDIVAPKWDRDRLVPEVNAYQDLLGLRLSGHCVQGVVLVRDLNRDLALVELDRVPESLSAVPLAAGAKIGDRIGALSHPVAEELMWLFAGGTVRSTGHVNLRRDGVDDPMKPITMLLQLPHQGSSSGGPVVNERGELIGVLASRDGSRQELAYAATSDEIREMMRSGRPLWKPETAAEWHTRAQFLEQRGRAQCALAGHAEAARLAPKDSLIQAVHARALAIHGDDKTAREAIKSAMAIPDRSPNAIAALADAHRAIGDRDQAVELADAAIKANPKLAEAYVARASLHSGRYAMVDLTEALFIDPNCAPAYRLRSRLHDPKDPEFRDKVIADLTRLIEIVPQDAVACERRACIQLDAKNYKKAVADGKRLIELTPLRPGAWMRLADVQFHAGDRKAAAQALASAVRIDSTLTGLVFRNVREYGMWLTEDSPTDAARLGEWYESSIRELMPWLPAVRRRALDEALANSKTLTDGERARILQKAVEVEWKRVIEK